MRFRCSAAWRARSRHSSAAGSSSTAAGTRPWTRRERRERLGAEEAIVVYRRTRDRMPAHDFEVEEAQEEGVLMKWLSTIKHVDGGKLVVERMELDETGFPQPTGELEELEADSLVLALGQETDLSLVEGVAGLEVEDGVVTVGPNMMTAVPGVFAGGDMVPAERTVTVAVGHGKKAARHIDAWLRGATFVPHAEARARALRALSTPGTTPTRPARVQPQLELARRHSTFDEVVGGLDETTALYEARRCLSCGNCFSCDNCYGVCPDNAVVKLGAPERAVRIRLRLLQGLRDLRRGVSVRRDRDGSRGGLSGESSRDRDRRPDEVLRRDPRDRGSRPARRARARCSASSGPNGAGKTTTIRLLLDLIRPTQRAARRSRGSTREPQSVEVAPPDGLPAGRAEAADLR